MFKYMLYNIYVANQLIHSLIYAKSYINEESFSFFKVRKFSKNAQIH